MNPRLFTPAALLALLLSPALAVALPVGESAPDFTVVSSQGDEVSLSDFAGKYVVLEWTNHKCPFVRKHYRPGNMQMQQRTAADKDIVWLSIVSSAPGKQGHVSAEEAEELSESREAAAHRVLLDESGDIGRAYKAKVTPHMYLVGKDGKLLYNGAIDSNDSADSSDIADAEQYILAAFDALDADEDIATDTTIPYGCSIKY